MQDCAFHPSQNLLAIGLVDGNVQLLQCGLEETTSQLKVKEHDDSCRAVAFHSGGTLLVSGSADHAIVLRDVEEGKVVTRMTDAHDCQVSR